MIFFLLLIVLVGVIVFYNQKSKSVHCYTASEKVEVEFDFTLPKDAEGKPHYLIIDLETTGIPKSRTACIEDSGNWPRIVTIAWIVASKDGKMISNQYEVIKQKRKVPERAVQVHGYTKERTIEEGREVKDVIEDLLPIIRLCKTVVAHNVSFDLPILKAEFYRNGFEVPYEKHKGRCTMKETTRFCGIPKDYGSGFKWPKLNELFAACFYPGLDVTIPNSHNALVDVAVCAKCFFYLRENKIIK